MHVALSTAPPALEYLPATHVLHVVIESAPSAPE
jgi:hypothetical protein